MKSEYVLVLNEHVTLTEGEAVLATYGFTTIRKDANYRILRVEGDDVRLNEVRGLSFVESVDKA